MVTEGLLLIPGFFGFRAFGETTDTPIRYFDHVEAVITNLRPDLVGRIAVSEPPPTGQLIHRVSNLYAETRDILRNGIRTGRTRKPVELLHLVGHSTGGVDARLLVNLKYGENSLPKARAEVIRNIGAVVTVSAPLHGTPIASRLRGAFDVSLVLSLGAAYALSIGASARLGSGLWRRTLGDIVIQMLHLLLQNPVPDEAIARLLLALDPPTAEEIRRFVANMDSDPGLIDDLTPEHMQALNEEIGGGDMRPIHSFVTVAPPPRATAAELLHLEGPLLLRTIYAVTYHATASGDFRPAAFPAGPWVDEGDANLKKAAPRANDGVVPSSSQTLDGSAAAIVKGDHLDVIGHYQSRHFGGTTVFKSDSGFQDDRFKALWGQVAALLRPPS